MLLDPNETPTHDRITLTGARRQEERIMFGRCSVDIRGARARGVAFSPGKRWRWAVIAPRFWSVCVKPVCLQPVSSRSVSLSASLLLCASWLYPATAFAAEVGLSAEEVRAEALFDEGLALQRLGQPAQACERFEASAEHAALPHALLQVGNCREPDDPLGALTSFEAALVAAGKVTDSTRRQAYEAAAKKRVAALESRLPTITVYPPAERNVRVEVTADGGQARAVARFGVPLRFNPGKYRLTASAPGTEPYALDLELSPEQRLELDIPPLDPATRDESTRDEPTRDESTRDQVTQPPPLAEPAGGLRFGTGPVVLASTGGVLVLTSLVTGRVSSSARGELDRQCSPPDALTGLRACDASLADTKSRVEDFALATDMLWISGSLLAGAGITWFLLDQKRPESPALEADCSGTGCGLSLRGTF